MSDVLMSFVSMLVACFAGLADGINQAVQFRYEAFRERFIRGGDRMCGPTKFELFWNPTISWKRKYKEGDPAKGPRFLGSTGPLVFLTDGYHLTRFFVHLSLISLVVLVPVQSVTNALILWLVYRVTFALLYNSFRK